MSAALVSPSAWEGQVALVAGASGGIGRAVAVALARGGARLVLTGRNSSALRQTQERIIELGRAPEDVELLVVELCTPEGAPGLVQRAVARFGRLDMVINAAGSGLLGSFHRGEVAAQWGQLEGNVGIALRLAHAALPALLTSRGRFVQIASGLAFAPRREAVAYSASQHALQGLIHGLRLEYGSQGVRFSLLSVAGAGVDTGFWDRAQPRVDRSAMLAPSEVASGVVQLLLGEGRLHLDELRLRTV